MKKILISLSIMAAAAAIVIGATTAFFSDTETSTSNTFTAGSLDLKVDSKASYNGAPVLAGTWGQPGGLDIESQQFFNFGDVKPGDSGENTISLHVYDNDAWGLFRVTGLEESDVDCTEPEGDAEGCSDDGELRENLLFTAWLDQGLIPGFQNGGQEPIDSEEGDNLMNPANLLEQPFWSGELADEDAWDIAEVLSQAYSFYCANQNPAVSQDGHDEYGVCQGIAADGRMVGSTTYYFGLAWELPSEVGNNIQTDSMSADMTFQVEQHRNNQNPF